MTNASAETVAQRGHRTRRSLKRIEHFRVWPSRVAGTAPPPRDVAIAARNSKSQNMLQIETSPCLRLRPLRHARQRQLRACGWRRRRRLGSPPRAARPSAPGRRRQRRRLGHPGGRRRRRAAPASVRRPPAPHPGQHSGKCPGHHLNPFWSSVSASNYPPARRRPAAHRPSIFGGPAAARAAPATSTRQNQT